METTRQKRQPGRPPLRIRYLEAKFGRPLTEVWTDFTRQGLSNAEIAEAFEISPSYLKELKRQLGPSRRILVFG